MQYHLVCRAPFHGYEMGQLVTEPDEVAILLKDREHHFNKIPASVTAPPSRKK